MALGDNEMNFAIKYHNASNRYGLRQAIIIAICENPNSTKTDVLRYVKKLPLTFNPDKIKVNNLIQKLVSLELIEYVYGDLNYVLRLTERGNEEYTKIITHQN